LTQTEVEMTGLNRRSFFVPALGTVALAAAAQAETPVAPPQAKLGNTGIFRAKRSPF